MLTHTYTREILFQYRSADTAIKHILHGGTIRLGSLVGTNDPRETDPWFFGMSGDDPLLISDPEAFSRKFLEWQRDVDRVLKWGCRVGCFSQDEPDQTPGLGDLDVRVHTLRQGYDHDRMWAQYADYHTGICVFFDKARLIRTMEEYAHCEEAQMIHGPVEYFHRYDTYDRPSAIPIADIEAHGITAVAKKHRERFARRLYLTKDSDWLQEHEYRFVWLDGSDDANNDPINVPIGDCIRAVCLGAHFPENRIDEIRDLHEHMRINVHQIRYAYGHLSVLPRLHNPDFDASGH